MFNLDYLGEVLSKWIEYRRNIERKLEKEVIKKNLLEPSEDIELSDEEIIREANDVWIKTGDYMLINDRVYDILSMQGKINLSLAEKNQIYNWASDKMDQIALSQKDLFFWIFDNKILKKRLSKKIAVSEYFMNLQNGK